MILDKYSPKVEDMVREVISGNHSDLKYLRVGSDIKNQKAKFNNTGALGRKKIGVEKESMAKPRLIVFIASAIGYNEIRSISQLAEHYHLIIGSNNFVTPKQYLDFINDLQE